MSTYFVGIGGDDGEDGTTWAKRKATLNGAENIPVDAADKVWVGPGTYRETLTLDVSGTAGNPITYEGDCTGANTDGVGGEVRITGSADDIALTRTTCITDGAAERNYRTFTGFKMDMPSTYCISKKGAGTNWIVSNCYFDQMAISETCYMSGAGQAHTFSNCFFRMHYGALGIHFFHTSTVADAANLVQNCIFVGGQAGVSTQRVGGITVKNCTGLHITGATNGLFYVATALAAGSTCAVNNNIIMYCRRGLTGTVAGEILEDYNTFFANTGNLGNVDAGAHSVAYPALFDSRWFFQLINAGANPSAKQLLSVYDLASYSTLIDLAGTSPSTTDMRGTGTLGAEREYGALEYDSTLDIQAKKGSFVGGGFIGGE